MLGQEIDNIISFLISPQIEGGLLVVKIIFILFSLFFLGGTILFLLNTSWLRKIILQDLVEVLTYKPYWLGEVTKRWKKTIKRLDKGLESEYKLAVIEADSVLNDALVQMGYAGSTLGERLEKITPETLDNIEDVWRAHKIRNNLLHDPDYKLTLEETKRVLAIFEEALKDLEVF